MKKYLFVIFILFTISISANYFYFVFKKNNCKNIQIKILQLLAKENYCDNDLDCKVVWFDCPFGCYNLVNKDLNSNKIKNLISNYQKNCPTCIHDCAMPPKQETLKCKNNKCINVNKYEK